MIPKETFTWIPLTVQDSEEELLHIVSAREEYLYTKEGKEYIDGISSWWTCIYGHRHPKIMQAIRKQTEVLDHVMLAGFIHDPAESLSKLILEIADSHFTKVFYSDNGSNAVEIALKLAIQYYKNSSSLSDPPSQQKSDRSKFIVFSASYHGDSIGAMNVSGVTYFNRIFKDLRFPVREFSCPDCTNCSFRKNPENCNTECLDPIREELKQNGESYAGLVIEPLIFGASGMIFYHPKVLRELREITETFGVMFILDEVFTGMGRTGEFFAFQKAGIVPDLVAFAKGLTGGALPLAATLVSGKIYENFLTKDPYLSFFHAHTMTGNAIACSAGLASVEFLSSVVLPRVKSLEGQMQAYMDHLAYNFPERVQNPRVMGAVAAFELNETIGEDEYLNPIGKALRKKLMEEGVLLRPLGNTVYVTPPYTISETSLEKIFRALESAISSL